MDRKRSIARMALRHEWIFRGIDSGIAF